MRYQRTTSNRNEATQPAVTLDEAKRALNIASNTENEKITGLIASVSSYIEQYLGYSLKTHTVTYSIQDAPAYCWFSLYDGPIDEATVTLRYGSPPNSYTDLAADDFLARVEDAKGKKLSIFVNQYLNRRFGYRQPECELQVSFSVGFGAPPALPEDVKQAALMLISRYYETPGAITFGNWQMPNEVRHGFCNLLWPWQRVTGWG